MAGKFYLEPTTKGLLFWLIPMNVDSNSLALYIRRSFPDLYWMSYFIYSKLLKGIDFLSYLSHFQPLFHFYNP